MSPPTPRSRSRARKSARASGTFGIRGSSAFHVRDTGDWVANWNLF
jgi:hypothetical protein